MMHHLVDRATSDKLIGPDWAMNVEICDLMNRDATQIKDIVRGIKKRLKSKNPKVKVLALTLLDTVLKNCGNFVHMHIVEKKIHLVLVKLGTKKYNEAVSDKLDSVIETWKEVIGNARRRHPQHYDSQCDIERGGGPVFAKNSDMPLPMYTTTRTHPTTSDSQNQGTDSSSDSEFPTLSLTDIQNVSALIDILSDMLSALDPADKEGLKQDVLVDLVAQSRSYKQRLVHLINTASDEELIRRGLSLNDDLHQILAKYQSMVSGTAVQIEKPDPDAPLMDIKDLTVTMEDVGPSASINAANQPPPGPIMDLLSFEDPGSSNACEEPTKENSLAIVPVNDNEQQQPNGAAVSQPNNALVLAGLFSQTAPDFYYSHPNYPAEQMSPHLSMLRSQNQQQMFYINENGNSPRHYNEQPQPHYGGSYESSGTLPRPPWETETTDNNELVGYHQQPQQLQVTQLVVTHTQQMPGATHSYPIGNGNMVGMYIRPIADGQMTNINYQAMQNNQLVGIPYSTQGDQMMVMLPHQVHGSQMNQQMMQQNNQQFQGGYGYDHSQGVQFINQGMHGLSMRDDNSTRDYASYVPPMKKPHSGDNKLFGDLVDMAKVKQKTPVRDTGASA
ncbi:hypothetical protein MKX01_034982 [Papaver californicum]|nr:hypothetical protein MKX01_034982 [Papaver californicum]